MSDFFVMGYKHRFCMPLPANPSRQRIEEALLCESYGMAIGVGHEFIGFLAGRIEADGLIYVVAR
jgi:hypothetical protein